MKKKFIFNISIVITFCLLAFIVGIRHEAWADEAQAWLLTRDTTLKSMFCNYLRVEGHPALWYLVIKFFQGIGLSYENFFIIPLIFSTLGVGVFVFKSKFPWYIKLFFPFTFFVFYQYSVVSRSYCLIFLFLSLIASFWDLRHEKCILFSILLILFMNLEAYTFMLAGIIYIYYFVESLHEKDNLSITKKICLAILPIFFSLTIIYMFPASDNTFWANGRPYLISDSFFTSYTSSIIWKALLSSALVALIFICYKKKGKELIQFALLVLPIVIFYNIKYYNIWHLGIVLLVVVFCFWIHGLEKNRFSILLILLVIIIQIPWSIKSACYDYKNKFSGASDVANFIKKYDYKNIEIYGLSFNETAINPYFQENIFENWNAKTGFFYWSRKNSYYDKRIDSDIMINNKLEMVVTSVLYNNLDEDKLKEDYNIYKFPGYSYIENFKFEDQTYIVYVLKDIDAKKK